MPQPAAFRRARVQLAVALAPPPPDCSRPSLAAPPAPAARVLYLVRHGAYAVDPKADESPAPGCCRSASPRRG